MLEKWSNQQDNVFSNSLILLISGTPGVGKTTLSYQLLKQFSYFRIVQETDLIREILRGYQTYVSKIDYRKSSKECESPEIYIPSHEKIFNYSELKQQCQIMKESIENVVLRQQRKKYLLL